MQIFQFAELKHFQSEQRCQNNCVDLYERSQGKSARGGGGEGEEWAGAPAAAAAHYPFWQSPSCPLSFCPSASAAAPGVFHQVGIFRTRINFMAPLSQSVAFLLAGDMDVAFGPAPR